jgi:hypothetical protein
MAWLYQDAVATALAQNEVGNPAEALGALLWLLREYHVIPGGPLLTRQYEDTGSLAEVLRRIARTEAAVRASNAENARQGGRFDDATAKGAEAACIKVWADLLEYLVPVWNFERANLQEAPSQLSKRLREGQAPPPGAGPPPA